ncbi:DUF3870 domain-containing protein [Sedimentibacter sp. MB31-C6]|uniref:DUF3870 domain-containing protein n=1 Tax=Sedimentibacter sp. MB31-C6 TaxID=3109366 RepID=UPI002DDD4634|nr:DUF3870 domain-containing protein [Sedimentibacter sp. MB36-C1]WSI03839.1 DUF3870 domain-containing protein [Sedimentibacter sp. MB36-C1]
MREGYKTNYNDNTVYFISYARLPENIPAALFNGYVGLGLVINYETGIIEDNSCTLVTKEAKKFLNDLIIGYNIYENDGVEPLINEIKSRFHGASQKSLCAILRDGYKKFCKWKIENHIK